MVFTRDNFTKQASSLSMFHSARQWKVGKTLKNEFKKKVQNEHVLLILLITTQII